MVCSPSTSKVDLVRDLLTKKMTCNHIVKCEGWLLKGQSPPSLSFSNLVGLALKTHLRANPTILVVRPFSICCSFSRILTFTFSIQNLQGFILIWKITFWHELFFWIANQLGHWECIIGMHTLIHVRNIFWIVNFQIQPLIALAYSIWVQSTFAMWSPFVWFFLNFLSNNNEFVNFESNNQICNLIHRWVDWTKILIMAHIEINGCKMGLEVKLLNVRSHLVLRTLVLSPLTPY
jgi:hypothetical protein